MFRLTSRNGNHYANTPNNHDENPIQHMILPAFPLIRLVFYGYQEQL